MFPIRDRRGIIISFGGRTLGTGQPKYVNGPETPVFSKRRTLFGLDLARGSVRSGGVLVVVEGYMDVIAASQAGFGGAVAPLGTALTNEQLDELWRVSPTPILCFDGDAAGSRAAARAMELALPMLTPERSLKFATLPSGEDPDSLVRKWGPQRFQDVLDAAQSPSEVLYHIVKGQIGIDTAEHRAMVRSKLKDAANRIGHKELSQEYFKALEKQFREETRTPWQDRNSTMRSSGRRRPGPSLPPRFVRTRIDHGATSSEWSRILTAILLRHPFLLHDVQNAYATLPLDGALARLRDALIAWSESAETLDSEGLIAHLTKSGCAADLEQIFAVGALPLPPSVLPSAMPAEAEAGWWHFFGFLNVEHLREEVVLAKIEADRNLTAETQRRLSALRQALLRVESGESDDAGLVEAS
jgi:DNA primase